MNGIVYRNSKKDKRWFVSRYTLEGRRITPTTIWVCWKEGWSREKCAYRFSVSLAEVDTAIAWCERRSAAARKKEAA